MPHAASPGDQVTTILVATGLVKGYPRFPSLKLTGLFAPENGWLEYFLVSFWPIFRCELLVLGSVQPPKNQPWKFKTKHPSSKHCCLLEASNISTVPGVSIRKRVMYYIYTHQYWDILGCSLPVTVANEEL